MRQSKLAWSPMILQQSDRSLDRDLTRRTLLRLVGGSSLALASVLKLESQLVAAQEAGTPMPAVTPQIGPQPDGSVMYRVQAGEMLMAEMTEYHAYFPEEITINEGDSIWFDFGMGGFHTVTFLAGGEMLPLAMPDPEAGTPVPDTEPKLVFNPAAIFPSGGPAFDGTAMVNSGIDFFRDPTQPFILTFTTAGSYDYLCLAHAAVMTATVIVQAAGSPPAHTQEEYDQIGQAKKDEFAALAAEERAAYAEAATVANSDGTTAWTVAVGAGGRTPVRIQSFLPVELEVKVGDSVTWVNRSDGEPHTVSFLGAGETPPEDPVEQFADGTPKFVLSALTTFPQGGNVWSGTGWVSSGIFGAPELGFTNTEYTLTFDTPGEYGYYCFLHGDSAGNGMAAKLTVLPA